MREEKRVGHMPDRCRRGEGGTEARRVRSPVNVQEEIFVIIMTATTMSRSMFILKNRQGSKKYLLQRCCSLVQDGVEAGEDGA